MVEFMVETRTELEILLLAHFIPQLNANYVFLEMSIWFH